MSFFFFEAIVLVFCPEVCSFFVTFSPFFFFLSGFTNSFVVVVRFFLCVCGGGRAYLLSSYLRSLVHLC